MSNTVWWFLQQSVEHKPHLTGTFVIYKYGCSAVIIFFRRLALFYLLDIINTMCAVSNFLRTDVICITELKRVFVFKTKLEIKVNKCFNYMCNLKCCQLIKYKSTSRQ